MGKATGIANSYSAAQRLLDVASNPLHSKERSAREQILGA
jgi:hypothetical protein